MTVLITWFATGSGGGERSTIELCNKLSASPRTNRVILLYAHSDVEARRLLDSRLSRSVSLYCPCVTLPLWRFIGFFWVFYICLKYRPCLVQVNIRAALAESLAARLFGCPVISCLRVIPFHRWQLWNYCFVDHMICISEAVREQIVHLGWRKQATVIYNGVEVDKFRASDEADADAGCRFYTVGRLVAWKRHDLFIEAAAVVHKQNPSARFFIFGNGATKLHLLSLIKDLNLTEVVQLVGAVEPTDLRLRRCGIFVFPSYAEAFGRVLVEAVLQGKVVVASQSGAVPELLPDHELLFPRGDAAALARLMLHASENFDKYLREAVAMRQRFATLFNLDRVAHDYETLYGRIVAARAERV